MQAATTAAYTTLLSKRWPDCTTCLYNVTAVADPEFSRKVIETFPVSVALLVEEEYLMLDAHSKPECPAMLLLQLLSIWQWQGRVNNALLLQEGPRHRLTSLLQKGARGTKVQSSMAKNNGLVVRKDRRPLMMADIVLWLTTTDQGPQCDLIAAILQRALWF